MFKKCVTFLIKAHLLITSIATVSFTFADNYKIPLEQITKDISYLASDHLKGRGNYSPEIHLAANYITKRFKENGLVAANGISGKDLLQKYQITKTTPKTVSLTINGQKISAENIAMASTTTHFSWVIHNSANNTNNIKVHNVGKNDDMQTTISKLNKQGGKHLVLLDPIHKSLFERYQHYFKQGTIKLTQENISKPLDNVIVIALSTIAADNIKILNASGVSTISKNELTNVVGILPGKTKPDEIVIFSAHYDHLGVKVGKGDVIYNGADDDASGTTAVINLAQYYAKKNDNARTLMFVAFSAEEIGGFGSSYFSNQIPPQEITAMINIEMIGKPSKFGAGNIWMTGMGRSNLGDQLNIVLAKLGKKIYEDPYPDQDLFYRSDNATLARLGVPAHSFSSTQLDKDPHYHKTSDDLSSLNLTSLHQIIKMLAMATQPLVDGTITPSRIDKSSLKMKGLIF
jgi:hypothetical protein